MIRARCIAVLALILAVGNSFGAGAMKFKGFPSPRQQVIVEYIPAPPAKAPAPLPQLVAPGLGQGAQLPKLSEAEIAKAADDEASKKAKLQIHQDRLKLGALMWQIDRAKAGSAPAMRLLGMRFLTGDGLEKDEAQARQWLQKGADGGDPVARKELARLDAAREFETKLKER